MKCLIALLLSLCLLLCACGVQPAELANITAPPTTEPAAPPSTEPTQPPVHYRHPITGEALDAPFSARFVSVVINNIRQAQPLYGIGQADILYEIVAEGGGSITRCLGVYSDIGSVPKIGSVRSARTYLVDLARVHNAILVHCGGSDASLEELDTLGYDAIDEYANGSYFYRDLGRSDAGYAWEHTLFAAGEDLLRCITKKGYAMDADYMIPLFSEDAAPEGESAATIEVRFNRGGKATVMTYDAQSGCYYGQQRWRNGDEYTYTAMLADATTQQAVFYRNILILYVTTTSDGYRMYTQQTGSGNGYYACGGRIVPILWHRESLDDPFTYTLTDGTPLVQGIGKTYAAILPQGSPVMYGE